MSEIAIAVQLYGAFRQYGDVVACRVRRGSAVPEVKAAIARVLDGRADALVADSVLADEAAILPVHYVFDRDCRLSLLPPVCGG